MKKVNQFTHVLQWRVDVMFVEWCSFRVWFIHTQMVYKMRGPADFLFFFFYRFIQYDGVCKFLFYFSFVSVLKKISVRLKGKKKKRWWKMKNSSLTRTKKINHDVAVVVVYISPTLDGWVKRRDWWCSFLQILRFVVFVIIPITICK